MVQRAEGQEPLFIDHHVHGVVRGPIGTDRFELLINEGGAPAPAGTSHVDSPVGLAIRMHCAPVLDLEPGVDADVYLDRRAELGPDEVNRRLLRSAGVQALFVDTGHRPDEVADPKEMAALADCTALEVARIERVAEEVAGCSDGPRAWLASLGPALADAAAHSVGFKTIVAYRGGFGLDPTPPSQHALQTAAEAWFAGGAGRLQSPVLLSHVLHVAADAAASRRIPIQAHAGFGDTDLTLHLADPAVFTPWVRELGGRGVELVFLHCYPYHRNAAYLAAVFPHVSFDVGCMFHYTGAGSRTVLAEALELAPWTTLLYSSDAFGLAEFAYLSALLFRRSMTGILGDWVGGGDCTPAIADEIRSAVYAGNARRIYRLDEPRLEEVG
jgi:predicted TIM-barrel fold metal-dependent hydrolase